MVMASSLKGGEAWGSCYARRFFVRTDILPVPNGISNAQCTKAWINFCKQINTNDCRNPDKRRLKFMIVVSSVVSTFCWSNARATLTAILCFCAGNVQHLRAALGNLWKCGCRSESQHWDDQGIILNENVTHPRSFLVSFRSRLC